MAQSVKLSDDIMSVVRRESSLQSRSVAGQITHWVNIGRAIEKSSTFGYQHINAALAGALSPDALSAEEQDVWFAEFADDATEPTDQERTFYAQRRQLGRGVGLTDDGDLVYSEATAPERALPGVLALALVRPAPSVAARDPVSGDVRRARNPISPLTNGAGDAGLEGLYTFPRGVGMEVKSA